MSNHTVLIPIADDEALAELEADFLRIEEILPRASTVIAPEIPLGPSGAGPHGSEHQRITRMTGSKRCCGGG